MTNAIATQLPVVITSDSVERRSVVSWLMSQAPSPALIARQWFLSLHKTQIIISISIVSSTAVKVKELMDLCLKHSLEFSYVAVFS